MKLTEKQLKTIILEELDDLMSEAPMSRNRLVSAVNGMLQRRADALAKKHNLSPRLAGIRPEDTRKPSNVRWGYALDLNLGRDRFTVDISRSGDRYFIDQGYGDSWYKGNPIVHSAESIYEDKATKFTSDLESMIEDMLKSTKAPKIRLGR